MNPNYPRNLVPILAVQLLTGEDYESAVHKARNIIEEAERQDRQARIEAAKKDWDAEHENEQDCLRNIPFAKALRRITGTDNEADALRCYRDLLRKEFSNAQAPGSKNAKLRDKIENKVVAELENVKCRGFSEVDIQERRRDYLSAFPRRKPKPRKK